MSRPQSADDGGEGGGVFSLTQKGEGRVAEMKKEIAELEQLLAGTNQTSQSTLLLKKRKEMREVDEQLELMKDEYKRRMDFCEERRLQFEAKQAKMRDNVIKFEKFIQENDAKRQRAELKIKQERKIYDMKCQEQNVIMAKIKELEEGKNQIMEELEVWSPYSTYLINFTEQNSDQGFEEISDVLKRYWTLRTSNESLMESVQSQENQVDDIRSRLGVLLTEKENSSLVNNSMMQQRQKVLDNVRIESKLMEQGTEKDTESQKNDLRDLAEIVQGVRNLFNRCQASPDKKVKTTLSKESTLLENLSYNIDIIHARCRDLLEITQEYDGGAGGGLSALLSAGGLPGDPLSAGSGSRTSVGRGSASQVK